jgi:hypothetical protein
MYSIPSDQQDMMKERTERSTTIIKQQEAAKAKPVKREDQEEDVKVSPPEVIDLKRCPSNRFRNRRRTKLL